MYTTISGDTWDKIAHKVYGDGKNTAKLIESNLEHVTTFVFSAGVKLKVPELDTKSTAKLPPWKS